MAKPKTRRTIVGISVGLAIAGLLLIGIVDRWQRSRDEIFGDISSWAEVPVVGASLDAWSIQDAQICSKIGIWHGAYYVTGATSEEALRRFADSGLRSELHHPAPDQIEDSLIIAARALKMDKLAMAPFTRSDNYLLFARIDEGFLEARFDLDSGRFLACVNLHTGR